MSDQQAPPTTTTSPITASAAVIYPTTDQAIITSSMDDNEKITPPAVEPSQALLDAPHKPLKEEEKVSLPDYEESKGRPRGSDEPSDDSDDDDGANAPLPGAGAKRRLYTNPSSDEDFIGKSNKRMKIDHTTDKISVRTSVFDVLSEKVDEVTTF